MAFYWVMQLPLLLLIICWALMLGISLGLFFPLTLLYRNSMTSSYIFLFLLPALLFSSLLQYHYLHWSCRSTTHDNLIMHASAARILSCDWKDCRGAKLRHFRFLCVYVCVYVCVFTSAFVCVCSLTAKEIGCHHFYISTW